MSKVYVKGFFALCIILFYGCKGHQGATVLVNPTPLEVHGDSLKFVVDFSLPDKPIRKKDFLYKANPKIGDVELPSIVLSGKGLKKNERLDTSISYSIPYSPDFNGEKLSIQQQYIKNDRIEDAGSILDLAPCCMSTSDLIKEDYRLMLSEKKNQNSPLKMVIQFNFPLNKWQIENDPLSEEDLNLISQFLNSKDSSATFTVSGNASPDGDVSRNEFLAEQRAIAVAAWINKVLEKENLLADVDFVNSIQISKNVEDWDGFEALLDSVSMTLEKKNEIIDIVNKDISPEEKERQIEDVTGRSIYALEKILSPLRKTSIVIEARKSIKRDTEIDSIAIGYVKNPESVNLQEVFSKEEWYYAADRIKGIKGKRTLIAGYYKTFPDDFKAFNDLGVLSLVQDTACPLVTECSNDSISSSSENFFNQNNNQGMEENFDYEVESDGAEVKIKKEGDEYTYEKETSDSEVKVKYDKEEDEAKYEREDSEGEVKIKFEGNEVKVSTPDYSYIYDGSNPSDSIKLESQYKEEFAEALRMFEMADKMAPGRAAPNCNIACIYSLQGRYEAAREYFEKSLKAVESQEAHYNLGLIYSKEGKYFEALEQFNKAGAIREADFGKGLVKLLSGDLAGAQADLENYITNVTDDASGYYALAVAYARMNNVELACINIQRACAIDSEFCNKASNDLEFKAFSNSVQFK